MRHTHRVFFSQETFLVTYFKETSFESFADTPSLIEGCNEIAFDKKPPQNICTVLLVSTYMHENG